MTLSLRMQCCPEVRCSVFAMEAERARRWLLSLSQHCTGMAVEDTTVPVTVISLV